MAPPAPPGRHVPFALQARKKITAFSKGLSIVLAAAAEPLMRYTTIYLALATALPVIKVTWLYGACQGMVIATPEFVIIGAFTIAEGAIKAGQKVWGVILLMICIALAAIMVATFVDIFIVSFNDLAIKLLNFSRCLAAVGFTVALGKLDKDEEEDAGPAQLQPAHPQLVQREELKAAVEHIKEELAQQVTEGLQNIRADVRSHVHVTEDMATGQMPQSLAGPGENTADRSARFERPLGERTLETGADTQEDRTLVPAEKKETLGPDKLELTLQFLREHPERATEEDIDAQLALLLGLKRPASARFWRLKAQELLTTAAAQEETSTNEQGAYSRLLTYVQHHQPTTQKAIAVHLSISERTVRRHLAAMRKSGQLPGAWIAESGQDTEEKAATDAAMSSHEKRSDAERIDAVSSLRNDRGEEDRTPDNNLPLLRVVK
jgi:hypothetical protein